jgi:hypothetical protein
MHLIIREYKVEMIMDASIDKGDLVCWEWGQVQVSGCVIELYSNISIAQYDFLSNIDEDKKAFLIKLSDGRKVIKMENEVFLKRNF